MNALKTKKLILLVYDILLIVGGGLMLIPIKKQQKADLVYMKSKVCI